MGVFGDLCHLLRAMARVRCHRWGSGRSRSGVGWGCAGGSFGPGVVARPGPPPLGAFNGDRRIGSRPDREHPDGSPHTGHRGNRLPGGRQAGDHQPRGQRQGPPGGDDDRRRRTRRPAQAGGHDHRAHLGQHRGGSGHRGRPAGLQVHLRDDRQAGRGEVGPPAGLRRRGGGLPRRRASRRPAVVLLHGRAAGEGDPGCLPSQPVLHPGQPPCPRADHRTRDLETDRGSDHPLRRRGRNRWHPQRRGPVPEVTESRGGHMCRRSRGLGVLRRLGPALSGRGGGGGLLASDL